MLRSNDAYKTFVELYNKTEEALKQATLLEDQNFFIPVLNEIRYACRALVEALSLELTSNEDQTSLNNPEFEKAIGKAELALRCAYNDCIDILVSYCIEFTHKMRIDFEKLPISETWGTNYHKDRALLLKLQKTIPTTRKERENRYEIYNSIVGSGEYEQLVDIAIRLPTIYEELVIKNKTNSSQKITNKSALIIGVVGVFVGVVGVIVGVIGWR